MALPAPILAIVRRSPAKAFCRKQAFKAGFNDRHLTRWLEEGLTERLLPGWYAPTDGDRPPDQLLHVALAYLRHSTGRPRPLIAGASALAGYGVPGFAARWPVHLLIQHGDRVRVRGNRLAIRHAELAGVERVHHRKLDLVTEGMALADLWEVVEEPELIAAVDRTRNHRRLATGPLVEQWEDIPGHPGARALRALAAAGTFDVDSGGERAALEALFSHCEVLPDCQVQLLDNVRVDFVYLFAGLVIEYYGGVHDGTADGDATRVMALELAGFRVIVITRSMLREPERVAALIDRVRREREADVLAGRLARPLVPAQPARRAPLRTLAPLG